MNYSALLNLNKFLTSTNKNCLPLHNMQELLTTTEPKEILAITYKNYSPLPKKKFLTKAYKNYSYLPAKITHEY